MNWHEASNWCKENKMRLAVLDKIEFFKSEAMKNIGLGKNKIINIDIRNEELLFYSGCR